MREPVFLTPFNAGRLSLLGSRALKGRFCNVEKKEDEKLTFTVGGAIKMR